MSRVFITLSAVVLLSLVAGCEQKCPKGSCPAPTTTTTTRMVAPTTPYQSPSCPDGVCRYVEPGVTGPVSTCAPGGVCAPSNTGLTIPENQPLQVGPTTRPDNSNGR